MFDAANEAGIDAQRGALRVQIAAVAAQQAALLEEESRLQRQHVALTQQQNQLAAYLDEKRQRAQELAAQVQTARAALKRERHEHELSTIRQAGEMAARQADMEEQGKQILADRRRTFLLRRRLKRHFQRRLAAERRNLRHLEVGATDQQPNMAIEAEKLSQERDALLNARLNFNGDTEIAKRQLQAAWQELRQEQSRLHEEHERKLADLATRAQVLRQREETQADAERIFQRQQQDWLLKRQVAEHEIQGLDNRIVNQRRKLNEMQGLVVSQQDNPVPTANPPVSPSHRPPPTVHLPLSTIYHLQCLADDLADQRLGLVEHWQRFLLFQQEWEKDRRSAADMLETLALDLPRKEQDLLAREVDLNRRHEELVEFRHHLEGWAARVRLRETTAEGQQCRMLAESRGREEAVEKHLRAMVEMRQCWAKRRRQELDDLNADRAACDELRNKYNALRQECWKRALSLGQQERELSEKSMALEEYRQHFVLHSLDAAAVDGRLLRLRNQWHKQNHSLMTSAAAEFDRLRAEAADLEERGRKLLDAANQLTDREAELTQHQNAWEEKLTLAQAQQTTLEMRLETAQAQRDSAEHLVRVVEAQVERLAMVLLDAVDEPAFISPRTSRACQVSVRQAG
jgi:hypothetical protein